MSNDLILAFELVCVDLTILNFTTLDEPSCGIYDKYPNHNIKVPKHIELNI